MTFFLTAVVAVTSKIAHDLSKNNFHDCEEKFGGQWLMLSTFFLTAKVTINGMLIYVY